MDDTVKSMLLDYEDYLLGKTNKLTTKYFQTGNERMDEKMAIILISHAILNVFRWTPEDVFKYMTKDMINKMGLQTAYGKLRYPSEISKDRDAFYIAAYVWPDIKTLNSKNLTLLMYRNVLHMPSGKFPKDYFNQGDAMKKAHICFIYAVQSSICFKNKEDMYEFFADEVQSRAWIKKMKLEQIFETFYKTPLEFMYDMLNPEQQDEELYNFHRITGPVISVLHTKTNSKAIMKEFEEAKDKHKDELKSEFKKFTNSGRREEVEEALRWLQ